MKLNEFSSILKEKLEKINIEINNEKVESLYKYMNLVCEWNKNINLTSIVEPDDFIHKHFIDSLIVEKFIKKNESIIDIGTGAGFPGIPLNILNGEVNNYTLVDSLNKRIIFLEEVVKQLNLKNIKLIHSRVEDLAMNNDYREKFDNVVSRAVAPLNVLVEYMLPFVKIGGKCICMKGSNIGEEINSAKKAINILGGRVINIERYFLPDSDIERNIIIIKKVRKTGTQYPRKAGIPKKNPII